MNVKQLIQAIDLKIVAGKNGLEREIKGGYIGDLLSDVMANASDGCIWLTIQTHQNIVAVALLKDMACIVVTGGNMPDEDTIFRADSEHIPLLISEKNSFELTVKLADMDNFL